MRLSNWLNRFRTRSARQSSGRLSSRRQRIEHLETRTVLAVVGTLSPMPLTLTILETGGEDLSVRRDMNTGDVQVLANGTALSTIPMVQSDALEALHIIGGEDNTTIDVSGLSTALFPMLQSITVESGEGHDHLIGSNDFAETLSGGDGNDTIEGGDGGDSLKGGDGNDSILAGAGDDTINAGDGNDTADGEIGADSIRTGDGADSVLGGDGNDTVDAGHGHDAVDGGTGDDSIDASLGSDTVLGGIGDDVLDGDQQDDSLEGGTGDDTLLGGGGDDTLVGGEDTDSLRGGSGDDLLSGDSGDDLIIGDHGNDTASGNDGVDVVIGGAGDDHLMGDAGDDNLLGNGGNDTIQGGAGDDRMDGGTGHDLIFDSGIGDPLTLSVSDAPGVNEGQSGTTPATFTVTLSAPSMATVSVNFSTIDGTASVSDNDYNPVSTTVVFAPGETVQTVDVFVNGDTRADPLTEVFFGQLSSPVGAAILNPVGSATITDEDPPFRLVASSFGGAIFEIDQVTAATTLIGFSGFSSFFGLARGPGTQIFGVNRTAAHQLLDVDPISATASVIAPLVPAPAEVVEGDLAYDLSTDMIYASFTSTSIGNPPNLYQVDPVTGATTDLGELLTNGTALTGVPINIDALAFRNGELYGVIPSGLSGADTAFLDSLLRIDLATREITNIGPIGFDLVQGTADLAYDSVRDVFFLVSGSTSTSLSTLYEVDPATGAGIQIGATEAIPDQITGLVFQPVPASITVSAGDVQLVEGNSGLVTATFTLTLSNSLTTPFTVDYSTLNGSAVAGADFVAQSGSVTFSPGSTTRTVTISITPDTTPEQNERFFLELSNPSAGAVLGNPIGVATILNDDFDPSADTFLGSSGNDTLLAADGDDVLNGGSGHDSMEGGNDDDSMLGGGGVDQINGGAGNDTIAGSGADDTLNSGTGVDIFIWNGESDGNDVIEDSEAFQMLIANGDAGVDTFVVDADFDRLRVNEGTRSITANRLINTVIVNTGDGDDSVVVNSLSRTMPLLLEINLGEGADTFDGSSADIGSVLLRINAGDGNDTVEGSRGSETVMGGDGEDVINGNSGFDHLMGENGLDTIDGGAGNDSLEGGNFADLLTGGDGDDVISGDAGDDFADGEAGNDTVGGGNDNDTVVGSFDDDVVDGGNGADAVFGGAGNDSLKGGAGNDLIRGHSGDDLIQGNDGHDTIKGDGGDDIIDAGDGDDTVRTGNGLNIVDAGNGADLVIAGLQSDTLLGGDGDDLLIAGGGKDSLFAGDGDDTLRGNGSFDRFNSGDGDNDDLPDLTAPEADDELLAVPASVQQALALLNGF